MVPLVLALDPKIAALGVFTIKADYAAYARTLPVLRFRFFELLTFFHGFELTQDCFRLGVLGCNLLGGVPYDPGLARIGLDDHRHGRHGTPTSHPGSLLSLSCATDDAIFEDRDQSGSPLLSAFDLAEGGKGHGVIEALILAGTAHHHFTAGFKIRKVVHRSIFAKVQLTDHDDPIAFDQAGLVGGSAGHHAIDDNSAVGDIHVDANVAALIITRKRIRLADDQLNGLDRGSCGGRGGGAAASILGSGKNGGRKGQENRCRNHDRESPGQAVHYASRRP